MNIINRKPYIPLSEEEGQKMVKSGYLKKRRTGEHKNEFTDIGRKKYYDLKNEHDYEYKKEVDKEVEEAENEWKKLKSSPLPDFSEILSYYDLDTLSSMSREPDSALSRLKINGKEVGLHHVEEFRKAISKKIQKNREFMGMGDEKSNLISSQRVSRLPETPCKCKGGAGKPCRCKGRFKPGNKEGSIKKHRRLDKTATKETMMASAKKNRDYSDRLRESYKKVKVEEY